MLLTRMAWLMVAVAGCVGCGAPDAENRVRDHGAAAEEEIAFRAVGQEPGWVLEVVKSGAVHFTYAYGEAEVRATVSEPEVDGATGTTVYHAISETHDLRVEIERGPCFDTMSGAAYETTVTVTLDGETYRGCGSPID